MDEKLKKIHEILEKVSRKEISEDVLQENPTFQELGLDSLALAELTVRVEQHFGVDVFADGIISTLAELKQRIGIET